MRKCKLCPALILQRRTSGLCPACLKRRNNRACHERHRGKRCRCGARVPGGGRCRDCFALERQIHEAHARDAAGPPVAGQEERIWALAELAREKSPLFRGPRPREVCRAT